MTDQSEWDRTLELDVLAAELRLEFGDTLRDVQQLAIRLSQLFPDHVTVEFGPSGGGNPGALRRLLVDSSGTHLVLTVQRGEVLYESVLRVHGIDLRRQRLSNQDWIGAVLGALAAQIERLRENAELKSLL